MVETVNAHVDADTGDWSRSVPALLLQLLLDHVNPAPDDVVLEELVVRVLVSSQHPVCQPNELLQIFKECCFTPT